MENKENKMTIVEAAKQYQELTNEAAKKKVIESCEVKTYLPIKDKIRIIDDTVYSKLGQINDDGLAYYDGIDGMVYLILCIIEGYTDLSLNDELEDFDALMASGLGNAILEAIGEDAEVFQNMFESVLDNFIQEHNTLSTYVGIIVQAIIAPLTVWSDAFTNFINDNGGIDHLSNSLQHLIEQANAIQ